MTREPDRFDAQARELVHRVDGMTYGHNDDERAAIVAAALRTEHEATKEWIAVNLYGGHHAAAIRALILPAAAPEAHRDTPCGRCGHPLWWHQWGSKEHAFCCAPLDELQREYCRCKNYEKPAAAPAAEDDTPRCNTFGAMGLPSIAPAAETGTCKNFWHPGHGDEIHARREAVGDLSAPHADHVNDSGCLNWKPAAETGKAAPPVAPVPLPDLRTLVDQAAAARYDLIGLRVAEAEAIISALATPAPAQGAEARDLRNYAKEAQQWSDIAETRRQRIAELERSFRESEAALANEMARSEGLSQRLVSMDAEMVSLRARLARAAPPEREGK